MMKLRKDIFSKSSVETGINAYSGIAGISFTEEKDYWVIHFKECRYGTERTQREFENYLIALENE